MKTIPVIHARFNHVSTAHRDARSLGWAVTLGVVLTILVIGVSL